MSVALRGTLLLQEPMANHTSWRVGGPVDRYYIPADCEDLAQFVASLPAEECIIWQGLGSNTLVRDGGIRGTVINTLKHLSTITQLDAVTIRAEAGVSCASLARFCARLNLAGAEFLAGIPGTVGGALAMNAGCFGTETWERVVAVETLSRQGHIQRRKPDAYQVSYRQVIAPADEWFTAGYFQLVPGDKAESLAKIRALLDRRAATQPTGDPNGGSVFRNPPGDYAARLIEACGLKAYTLGGAQVSVKHANFIINLGNATAADIEQLIEYVAAQVYHCQGVSLMREVHIIGDKVS